MGGTVSKAFEVVKNIPYLGEVFDAARGIYHLVSGDYGQALG